MCSKKSLIRDLQGENPMLHCDVHIVGACEKETKREILALLANKISIIMHRVNDGYMKNGYQKIA